MWQPGPPFICWEGRDCTPVPVASTKGSPLMTQIEQARRGTVTPEMEAVARDEGLDPELVRGEVARGRMVIPANRVHLQQGLRPMGVGIAGRTKINANIGKSAITSDTQCELEKLHAALKYGADTVMDLSTGDQIDAVRQRILQAADVPVGTVMSRLNYARQLLKERLTSSDQ